MSTPSLHVAEAVAEYIVASERAPLLDVLSRCEIVERANEEMRRLTGVRCFFPDRQSFEEFQHGLTLPAVETGRIREWGDFQTPPGLAAQVCRYLVGIGFSPQVIVEPTYGLGNFILAALDAFPQAGLVYGIEIQEKYEWHLKIALLLESFHGRRRRAEIELHQDDVFTHRFPNEVLQAQDILVIGNPPWVTSAELGALGAHNLPVKRNLKRLNGLDAITGKSNFDIGEFILLHLLDLFADRRGTLAMLCKNSVIKNIVEILPQRGYRVSNIHALGIDAAHEFGAAVNAALLVMGLGVRTPTVTCQVAMLDRPDDITSTFGWTHGRFVSDVEGYEATAELDGASPLVWRQGLKHDCVRVMELEARDGLWVNAHDEVVDVEPQWVYWLLKGSDLRSFEVVQARKKVIVPQRALGEDTTALQKGAPKLWDYLVRHSECFERRKSSIYRNAPRFAIFGVGEYSFKPYKVAISGLHKKPHFALVLPIEDRPVMLDDTCYFLGFNDYLDALFTALLLNSLVVREFLRPIVFLGAKRPYTKEVLMRVDLSRAASRVPFQSLAASLAEIGHAPHIPVTEADFEAYKQRLSRMGKGQKQQQLSLSL
jgi:hypothetical protein